MDFSVASFYSDYGRVSNGASDFEEELVRSVLEYGYEADILK